jgi:predicted nucleic acid-binding protein
VEEKQKSLWYMRVVADTNIIFSAIISAKGLERDVLIRPPKKLKLYAPYYLREEIMEHLPKLQKISGLPRLEVLESFELVTKQIFFFSEELIPLATWMKAYEENERGRHG